MKKLFLVFSLALLSFVKYYQVHYRGFCEAFLKTNTPKNLAINSLDKGFLQSQDEPFYYLACGRQCFVFSQKSSPYVLKILSFKPVISKPLYQDTKQAISNFTNDLKSYLIAFNELKEESGLVGIKLGQTEGLPKILIKDPLGIKRVIDLNQVDFLLQFKASPLGDLSLDSSLMGGVKSLIDKRLQKNIQDKDPRIHRNIGLIKGRPIFLDLGSFKKDHVLSDSEKRDEISKIFGYHQEHLNQKAL